MYSTGISRSSSNVLFALAFSAILLLFAGCASGPVYYTGAEGERMFDDAEALYAAGDLEGAYFGFTKYIDQVPTGTRLKVAAEHKQDCAHKISEVFYRSGEKFLADEDYEEADYYFKLYLEEAPNGPLAKDAVLKRLECGFDLLYGAKTNLMGTGIYLFKSSGTGAEIVKEILRAYPYEDFSDEVYLKLAGYYYSLGEYLAAVIEYQTVLDLYPDSPYASTSQYQIGMSHLILYKGAQYNPKYLTLAKKGFLLFLANFGQTDPEKAKGARDKLVEITNDEAERYLAVGRFYSKMGRNSAAKVYFETVKNDYSTTKWAPEAEKLLKELGD